jgi:N-acetyl sugar amidotransferase
VKTYYNLPEKVIFCKLCVMSNQRPASVPEFRHTRQRDGATYMSIGEDGICDACKQSQVKDSIDWEERERELLELLSRYRRTDGGYDCLIPGSGGKDSAFQAHVLKYEYGMNPLTCTWAPTLYTEYGYENFKSWIDKGGFDNLTFNQNGRVKRKLTELAVRNLFHPFQPFILGQKNFAPKLAAKLGIPLVFYGENEAEYGNALADNQDSLRDKAFHSVQDYDNVLLAGVSVRELTSEHNLSFGDLRPYLPMEVKDLETANIEVHYLGYYKKWIPQEAYYYAVANTGFKARPYRSQGTYSKYHSIDDKIDDLHFYTTYVKYGVGRDSYDAAQEIRNRHISREEGQLLVDRFDGEFPERYFEELMNYLSMSRSEFMELCDEFRSPHLWGKDAEGNWKLNHNVNKSGLRD